MDRFYYVPDWQSGPHIPAENVLVSAGTMWHKTRMKFEDPHFLPKTTKRVFIDSGGFTFLTKWKKYPFNIETFLDFIRPLHDKIPIEQVAVLDYPCEPDVNRAVYKTNIERIKATVENAVQCFDLAPELNWVPVVQGYNLYEYFECLDLYNERGIEADTWAIGSVCTRSDIAGPKKILTRLKNVMRNKNLHAFGISLRLLRDLQIWNSIFSADSAAWQLYGGYAYTVEEKLEHFHAFNREIERLSEGNDSQTVIHDHLIDDTSMEVIKK